MLYQRKQIFPIICHFEFFSQRLSGDIHMRQAANAGIASTLVSVFSPLFINAAANPSTLERYQTIRVSCGDSSKVMKLIQKGKTVTLSASTAMLNYKIKGGDKSIELYTNSDSVVKDNNGATWYVESKPEWAEVTLDVKKKGFLSIVKDAVTGTVEAATADDVKKSNVKIYVQSILKSDPEYSTGRRGEVVFASQDKRYKVIIIQQK